MGASAGALLNVQGILGLAGWQWLFLVEGMPAVLLGLCVFFLLPDSPGQAGWLTASEKRWIEDRLAADRSMPGVSADHGFLRALSDRRILLLGLCNVCIMGGTYAFILSAPAVLRSVTHLDATYVGFLIAAVAGLGAIAMITAGWFSDYRRERHLHLVFFLLLQAGTYVVMGVTTLPALFVAAYAIGFVASMSIQAVFWLIPGDVLQGKSAAAGLAAVGSIGMVGAFVGPYVWGVALDYTGSYQAGLLALFVPYAVAALIIAVLRRNLEAKRSAMPAQLMDPGIVAAKH
jgi:ACS family tartrate transporter-like MFS transporter